jgi:hypothetical protein
LDPDVIGCGEVKPKLEAAIGCKFVNSVGNSVLVLSERALADFGVAGQALFDIHFFATKYTYQGKRILLVRNPDFDLSDEASVQQRLNYLRALLSEQESTSDVLVFDDTHNPIPLERRLCRAADAVAFAALATRTT